MSPLLTIAIPTFNRLDCLTILVDRLIYELSKIANWPSLIEIVIVNNASSDGTYEYLNELQDRFNCIVIHNHVNLGMDGNFIKCFEVAGGKWLWLCSDDDLPMRESIPTIIRELQGSAKNCGLVYLPTKFCVGSLKGNQSEVEFQSLSFDTASKFAARVNGLFTFITCIISNRQSFLEAVPEPDFENLRGSFFSFFEWELELLKREEKFGYFRKPILLARAENSRGYDFANVFTQRFKNACMAKLSERPDLCERLVDGMLYRHLPNLFYKTRLGRNGNFEFDSTKARRDYLAAYGGGLFYLFVMRPIFHCSPLYAKTSLFVARIWGKIWIEWATRVANCRLVEQKKSGAY